MGCTSAKQVSAVPSDEDGRGGKAYSNGDLFTGTLAYSHTHSLTHLLTHSLAHALTHTQTRIHSVTRRHTYTHSASLGRVWGSDSAKALMLNTAEREPKNATEGARQRRAV